MEHTIVDRADHEIIRVHVGEVGKILVTGTAHLITNEINYSVTQYGAPKARNIDTIFRYIRHADEELEILLNARKDI